MIYKKDPSHYDQSPYEAAEAALESKKEGVKEVRDYFDSIILQRDLERRRDSDVGLEGRSQSIAERIQSGSDSDRSLP